MRRRVGGGGRGLWGGRQGPVATEEAPPRASVAYALYVIASCPECGRERRDEPAGPRQWASQGAGYLEGGDRRPGNVAGRLCRHHSGCSPAAVARPLVLTGELESCTRGTGIELLRR